MALAACESSSAECTLDADCDQGLACEMSACVPICIAAADCAVDEVCMRGVTTQRQVCSLPVGDVVRSTYAVLRDDSSGASCDGPAPGTQLAFVLVEDAAGEIVA